MTIWCDGQAPSRSSQLMNSETPFKWRHFLPDVILLNVRWYSCYSLSYRDLEEMMLERGVEVDHTTIYRWVQAYAPELDKRIRRSCLQNRQGTTIERCYQPMLMRSVVIVCS
jgi:transposase-like protein